MNRIYAGQSAWRITVKTFTNLEGVMGAAIRYRRPDGVTGEFAAGVGDTAKGVIFHEVIEGEIGLYQIGLPLVGVVGVCHFCRRADGRRGNGEGVYLERRGRVMAKRKSLETKYLEKTLRQRAELEEFAKHETEWAEDLLLWYRIRKEEIPDDEYRAVAFFTNREYLKKPGSLTLCYLAYMDMMRELPSPTKETSFYLLTYRYRVYCAVLEKGGYGGFGV